MEGKEKNYEQVTASFSPYDSYLKLILIFNKIATLYFIIEKKVGGGQLVTCSGVRLMIPRCCEKVFIAGPRQEPSKRM